MKRFTIIALCCFLITITACATNSLPAEEESASPIAVESPVVNLTPTPVPDTPIVNTPIPDTPIPTPPNPTVTLRATFTSTSLPPEPSVTPEPPVATSAPTSYPLPAEEPTPLEQPTEEPTPTDGPPVQSVTFETLPQLTSDLLFLDGGRLMHWVHERNQLDVAVGPEEVGQAMAQRVSTHAGPGMPPGSVLASSVSADGSRVAVIRRWNEPHYEIAGFEPATGLVETLVQQEREFFTFALSPDGEWIAYTVMEQGSNGQPEGVIYAFPWSNPAAELEIGYCRMQANQHIGWGCDELMLWSPDSRQVAWADGFGLWSNGLEGGEARQLVANNAGFSPDQNLRRVRLLAWAPTGRYLLTRVGYMEGGDKQVLDTEDTETGQMVMLPDSFEYPWYNALSTWLADGRLFVIYPQLYTGENNQEHLVRLWRIDPTSPDLLVLDGEFPLAMAGFPGLPSQRPDGYVSVASQAPTGHRAQDLQEVVIGHLVLIEPTTYEIIPLTPLPNQKGDQLESLWAPDNSGVIVSALWGERRPLYMPADGQIVYDLSPIMSSIESCCFRWLPN